MDKKRREKATLYATLLAKVEGIETPREAPHSLHVFNYYTIRIKNKRDELQQYLSSQGVATAIYYPVSLHLQEVYKGLGYKPGDMEESEKAQQEVLSLPLYPELEDESIRKIVDIIIQFMQKN
jgi:dTDP-4-amino-4,6-dideoxygalactose transaminase